jgi:hypothetical protein
VLAGCGLVALADGLFFGEGFGATLGVFALSWLALTAILQPAIRRRRQALIGLLAAGLFGFVLIDHPSLIGWVLFWIAITIAAISPRSAGLNDAWAWTRRVLAHSLVSISGPALDGQRLRRVTPPGKTPWRSLLAMAALPLGGGAVFLALFASANPIIAGVLSGIRLPPITFLSVFRALFWMVVFMAVWATLRPSRRPRLTGSLASPWASPARSSQAPVRSVTSVTLALIVFNALFAVENALDLTFLWGGAGLPSGMTLAQYAHRGAYPLVFTALLAGGFSLLVLREGSAMSARSLIRWLVGLWVAQNVLLSASSILRTVDYVEAYSLTRFRIAALLWMGLVTLGLVLIGWRMLRGKSRAWLINANALVLGVVLTAVSVGDLGAIAASWNVHHARDAGGTGADLDVCYLRTLGPSALLQVMALEQRKLSPDLHARLAGVQQDDLVLVESTQRNWHRWTLRGARRLNAALALLHQHPELDQPQFARFGCDQHLAGPQIHSTPAPIPSRAAAPFASGSLTSRAQP